ncbi:MAG: S-layer homology domain-containing protein [Oscillospiraceae bacterium]
MNRIIFKTILKYTVGLLIIIGLFNNQPATYASTICDISDCSDYAKQAVTSLAERNIINGDNNGNFYPRQALSRERMITMIVRAFDIDTTNIPSAPTFKDVPSDSWAYPYIEAAFRSGLIKGISPDVFGNGQPCTREQMAAIIVRALAHDHDINTNNIVFSHIEKFGDFNHISDWAKPYVDTAVAEGLMNGTDSSNFSPLDTATMEQSAVVIDRLISNNEELTGNDMQVTLNGDKINIASPVVNNEKLLVPFDFIRYFSREYTVQQNDGLIYVLTYNADPHFYVEAWAKINSSESYIFTDKSINESPYDNANEYTQNKVNYLISPVLIDSVLYVPADFISDATGAEYELVNNTLSWTDEKTSDYPTLLEALRNKIYQTKDEFDFNIKADFYDQLTGNQMKYDFTTTGQFDFSGSENGEPTSFHTVTEKIKTTNVESDTGWHKVTDLVKISNHLYTMNAETGQYELTDQYASDQRSKDYTFISNINSVLSSYFVRYRAFEVYQNAYVDGHPTVKYVLHLSDIKDIAYVFGNSSGATVNGADIEYSKFRPIPFPDTDYDALFLGRHGINNYYPVYSDFSAEIEVYVNEQNEIVKEVLYTEGNRYDYRSWYETWDIPQNRTYEDVDYNFVYTIEFKPFTGSITLQ